MREAVGGSMLFYIILIFIFIYIVFIGLIINYAATYRATNYVVTTIEETEGDVSFDTLKEDLKKRNYHNGLTVTCSPNHDGAVYSVETYVTFEFPLIGIINRNYPITNDTKTIYGEECKQNPLS